MGFNMSWIFVDGITEKALYEVLDLTPTTEETPDHHDLGTSLVPLAGAALKSGWCAVFAKYALVMDATVGKSPIRLTRLPPRSRCVTCVVLEHAMVSHSSLWQDGHLAWEIRHDPSQDILHLETRGNLPPAFAHLRDTAMEKQRAEAVRRRSSNWGVDHIFDVPIDMATSITRYRHDCKVEDDFFNTLWTLEAARGNVLTKLNQPPGWWQTVGSISYE